MPFQKGQPSLYSDPGKIWNVICIYLNQLLPLKETSVTSVLQNQGFWRCCQCHLTKLPGAVTLVHLKTIMPLLCVLQGLHLHYAMSLPGSSPLWKESVPVPAPTLKEELSAWSEVSETLTPGPRTEIWSECDKSRGNGQHCNTLTYQVTVIKKKKSLLENILA